MNKITPLRDIELDIEKEVGEIDLQEQSLLATFSHLPMEEQQYIEQKLGKLQQTLAGIRQGDNINRNSKNNSLFIHTAQV